MTASNAKFSADGRSVTVGPVKGSVVVKPRRGLEPGSEFHYSVGILNHEIRLIRRPISTPAPEGTIAFLDGVTAKNNPGRQVGIFKDGEWRGGAGGQALRITPHSWTVCAEMERGRGGA